VTGTDDAAAFFADEDEFAMDEGRRARPNGHDQDENWRTLPAIDLADVVRWRGQEPAEIVFTVEGLVPQGMVTLLTSIGGAGKTLLQQMAGTAVASGTANFLGRACVVGRAAGVYAEDPDSVLHLRQSRINSQLGVGYDRLGGRLFLQSYFGLSVQLWRNRRPTPFMAALEQQLARIEALRLLTLDNAALLYAGDENSRPEVTEFLATLNGLADRLTIGILLSAHASKSNDGTALRVTSGSTAWVNACRSVLELKPPTKDGEPTLLTLVKANHAATGNTIPLEWRDRLLVPFTSSMSTFEARARRDRLDNLIFQRVAEGWDRGHPFSSAYQAPDRYLPTIIAGRSEFKRDEVENAMRGWIASGHLILDDVPGKRRGGLRVAALPFRTRPEE
jgi:RecA-family ATPase